MGRVAERMEDENGAGERANQEQHLKWELVMTPLRSKAHEYRV